MDISDQLGSFWDETYWGDSFMRSSLHKIERNFTSYGEFDDFDYKDYYEITPGIGSFSLIVTTDPSNSSEYPGSWGSMNFEFDVKITDSSGNILLDVNYFPSHDIYTDIIQFTSNSFDTYYVEIRNSYYDSFNYAATLAQSPQPILGTPGPDVLIGSSSNETLQGLDGDDILQGGGGNDSIKGDGGNDFIDGGTGIDAAVFSAPLVGYIITPNSDGSYRVSSTFDGLDTVSGIEKLQFSDQLVDLATFTGLNEGDSVFRFYNRAVGTHFYTADTREAENVMATLPQYAFEGVAFDRNTSGGADAINVHRFYNTVTGAHFYTADANEAAQVRATLPEYSYEGIAYQAHSTESAGTTELYRFYNTATNTHFYTADAQEAQNVKIELAGQYSYEGVAYYVDLA